MSMCVVEGGEDSKAACTVKDFLSVFGQKIGADLCELTIPDPDIDRFAGMNDVFQKK